MAGVALLLRYQWRAYWRRFSRDGSQAPYLAIMMLLLGWLLFIKLPPMLLRAAQELAEGKTGGSDQALLMLSFAWLFPLLEDPNISLTAKNLCRFPLTVGSLLAIRILSIFISPLAMMIVAGSLMSLFPFLKSPHPLIGVVAALLCFGLSAMAGLCLSHAITIAAWRRGLLAAAAITIVPFAASLLASGNQAKQRLLSMIPLTPPHLATSAATGLDIHSVLIPLLLLLMAFVSACFLLIRIFRQSLSAQPDNRRSAVTRFSFIRFPGRLGGLLNKEQRYFRKLLDPWLGFLLTLACTLALLKNAIPPIIFQTVILLAFSTNASLMMNFFGLDAAPELSRYLLFPLRGKQIVVAKNLGIIVVAAAQLLPVLLLACWRFGWLEALFGLIEATALMLAHMAWGNLRSVSNPGRMRFYRLSSGGNPLIALAGFTFGSLPGVVIIFLAQSRSNYLIFKLTLILALTATVYLVSIRWAGAKFERDWQAISNRLS